MSSTDLAAWVQAIGSIAAIIAAIWIARRQFRDAMQLQARSAMASQLQKYSALQGVIGSAIHEFGLVLKALQGPDPKAWFDVNSGVELMEDFNFTLKQISPLDMPSALTVGALIKFRDVLSTAAWNANEALRRGVDAGEAYKACVDAMADNLKDVATEQTKLNSEFMALQKSVA